MIDRQWVDRRCLRRRLVRHTVVILSAQRGTLVAFQGWDHRRTDGIDELGESGLLGIGQSIGYGAKADVVYFHRGFARPNIDEDPRLVEIEVRDDLEVEISP